MSDLEKYSITGLDGVPRIDPIFTISPPVIESITRQTFLREDTGSSPRPGTTINPYRSVLVNKISKQPDIQIKPENNPLHQYASYTYNISLHLLSINTYNKVMGNAAVNNNQAFNYIPENVLVASGGRIGLNSKISDIETGTILETPQRHPFWQENFFFEEFKCRTVISPTQASRGSNVIEGSMQIVEPNGFTFINRLIQTVLNVNPNSNYIFNPYMIQIDFYGMNADTEGSTAQVANPVRLDGLKKLFPICFTGIKTRVTNKGTLYTIDFVPYSHTALNQMNNVSPASFTVPATTVQEFFNNNTTDETTFSVSAVRERQITLARLRQERNNLSPNDIDLIGDRYDANIEQLEKQLKNSSLVNGFCAAYNEWQKALIAEKQNEYPDLIDITFDPAIGNAKLIRDSNVTQALADKFLQANKILLAQSGQGGNTIKFDGTFVTVPAGTIIDKLIEFIVRNSEYFLKQISPYNTIDRNNPVNWYKIIPRVELGPYNKFRKKFSTKTTFHVIPYKIYGAAHPYIGNGLPTGQVKKYDYLFTGKNTDVLDLSVDFNLLYNISMPVNRGQVNVSQGLGNQNVEQGEVLANQVADMFGTNVKQAANQTNSYIDDGVQKYPIQFHSGQRNYQPIGGGTALLSTQELAASVLHSINLDSRGDMINVKLKILGDPDFIKQDDIFYNSTFFKITESRIGSTGSLWMDTANLTIQVNINSPTDYDDSTGIAFPNIDPYGGIFTYNAFSGIYKVVTIENLFQKGKFEQVLDIVRSPIQSKDQLASTDAALLKSNREQYENALKLARNISTKKPANSFNAPLRSTNGALTQLTNSLYGQQTVVNKAADAIASLNNITGGLGTAAAIPGILASVGVQVATRALSETLGKGLDIVAKNIREAFSVTEVIDFEGAAGVADLANLTTTIDFEGAAGFADLANFGALL